MFDAAGVVTGPGGRAAAEDEIRTRTRSDEATKKMINYGSVDTY